MNTVKKYTFSYPDFHFLDGHVLDVNVGYETYGQLNEQRNNAILLCHFWTSTSHAAGWYTADDSLPGWWDILIGPGKAIDTNRYFIICSDTLANVQAFDPLVISTGPASIDPHTGKPYGSRFPAVTFRDMVQVQKALLNRLGIPHLHAVGGPSAGGMQALEWACTYPDFMNKMFGISTYGRSSAFFTMGIYRWCRALIQSDPYWHGGNYYNGSGPQTGLRRALSLITLMAQTPRRVNAVAQASEAGWDLSDDAVLFDDPNQVFPYEEGFNVFVDQRAQFADANAFLTIGRAAVLHNVGYQRGGFAQALKQVKADVLMVACEQDLFFPPQDSRDVVDAITSGGGQAEFFAISSEWGHFACLFDTEQFAQRLHDFLG